MAVRLCRGLSVVRVSGFRFSGFRVSGFGCFRVSGFTVFWGRFWVGV